MVGGGGNGMGGIPATRTIHRFPADVVETHEIWIEGAKIELYNVLKDPYGGPEAETPLIGSEKGLKALDFGSLPLGAGNGISHVEGGFILHGTHGGPRGGACRFLEGEAAKPTHLKDPLELGLQIKKRHPPVNVEPSKEGKGGCFGNCPSVCKICFFANGIFS